MCVCVCVATDTDTHTQPSMSQSRHLLPLSRPCKPQAMSEMCHASCFCVCVNVCVCERVKLAWHTKGGERCYLLSELRLCLPYISAPKPLRLSITHRKEPVAKGEGVRNPIISSALISHQVRGWREGGGGGAYKRGREGGGRGKKTAAGKRKHQEEKN